MNLSSLSRTPRPFLPSEVKRERPAVHFERAAFAAARFATRQFSEFHDSRGPHQIARTIWPQDEVTPQLLTRAATSPAATTTTGWAAELAQQAIGDFVASLAPQSAAARLINAGTLVLMDGANSVRMPRRQGVPGTDVAWVGETRRSPRGASSYRRTQLGPVHKLAAICPLSREVIEFTSGETVVSTLLREDMAASLDAALFSTAAASSVRPAGLLNGLTPLRQRVAAGRMLCVVISKRSARHLLRPVRVKISSL